MDYDSTDIPVGYDRARGHGPEMMAMWMNQIERHIGLSPRRTILDLGCGTGRFADALATHFVATILGLDPSQKMLDQARAKRHGGRVHYARGAGEAIPLSDASVDAIFISMAFHHFRDPGGVARECWTVLSKDGRVMLRTGTRDRISAYPYVPFFPPSLPLLEARLPTATFVSEVFQGAGFQTEAFELVVQTIAPTLASYADKLAAGGDSILASLSTDDLKGGLSALRTHASLVDPEPVIEPIDFFVFRC